MLTLFGSAAVTVMMVSYAVEGRSRWFVLSFALGSAATSLYSGLEGVWPIMVIEAIWALIASRRFLASGSSH